MSSQAPPPAGLLPAERASSARYVTHLLTLGTLLMSTGCQAITTIFETGVWVGVILVVVILGAVAFAVSKFRGRGGPPGGTIASVAVVLLGTALSAGAPPPVAHESPVRRDQDRVGSQQRPDAPALDDVRLQGCVARDDGWQSRSPEPAVTDGSAPSSAESRGEMFVLRDASRIAGDADAPAGGSSPLAGETYRLAPRAGLGLSTFERQRVEVRGWLRDGDDPDATSLSTDHRNSKDVQGGQMDVQGGQMQDVGQTMSGGRSARGGESTSSPRTPGSDGETGDGLRTMVVTSLRVLAPTCGEQ